LLGKVDDGLPARFLWIWPDRPAWCRPCSSANLRAFEAAIRRLEQLKWGVDENGRDVAVTLSLDPDAADVFAGIQQFHRKEGDEAFGLLKSFIGKLDGIALRLSLAVELALWAYEGGEEPRSIRRETVEAVGDFLEAYAIPMAARVYGDAALPPVERNAAMLARHIARHKLERFNARNLRRESRLPGLRDAESMRLAIEALVEADWLRPDGQRQGQTPGRHSADYVVNPAALEEA
jgi:putative DNA primase/helicase